MKADCCLILEGPQGSKKSTALKTLAGPYFADELADLGTKDSVLQTQGVWIIELSELDSLSRAELGRFALCRALETSEMVRNVAVSNSRDPA